MKLPGQRSGVLTLVFILTIVLNGYSSPFQIDTLTKGTFILHKFQQAIGKETYSFVREDDLTRLNSDFKFTDRGREVPLQTFLTLNNFNQAVFFRIKGSTSRYSTIDAEVETKNDTAFIRVSGKFSKRKVTTPYFAIGGYSPASVQMMLIRYWKQNNKPDKINLLPAGEASIKFDGYDTISSNGKQEVLERYFVSGLIWGKELLWLNQNEEMICLFTIDAEGDKFEAVKESHLQHLPMFIRSGGLYGVEGISLTKTESTESNSTIALTGGHIVDVVNGNHVESGTILIKNGVILDIGKPNKIKIPKSAKVIDVTGKTILPGLWDMHAHFQQVEWGPAYIAAGVTTVRDCGNEFDFINSVQQAIDLDKGVGPTILKAGIVDSDSPFALGIIRINNKEDAEKIVMKYKESGFSQIKIYSSIKPDLISVISDEAHRNGMTVTGHVPRGVTLEEAIELGFDQINHVIWIYRAMISESKQPKVNINDPAVQRILKLLKDNNIVVDPTLGVIEWAYRSVDQPFDAFEPGVNSVSDGLKEIFRNTGQPPSDANKNKVILESCKEIVNAMHKIGIPIVAGTDMMIPGYSLYRELELYNEAGLSNLEAIQTATIVPARVMGKDKQTGSIEVGKSADIIIIDGNPLQSISEIRNVVLIVKGTRLYDPRELRKLIDFKP